jgi:hypothetical protein
MLVVHANWTRGALRLWAESLAAHNDAAPVPTNGADAAGGAVATAAPPRIALHPAAVPAARIREALAEIVDASGCLQAATDGSIRLRLPSEEGRPRPSDRLAGVIGLMDGGADLALATWEVPSLSFLNEEAIGALLSLEEQDPDGEDVCYGHSLRYWMTVARFVLELLVDQRFIPTLVQSREARLSAAWQPWLHDDAARERVGDLIRAMPPVVRAVLDDHAHRPWPILDEALRVLTDSTVRRALIVESFVEAVEDRDPLADPHVAWLGGLLDADRNVGIPTDGVSGMLRDVGRWIAVLDDTGHDRPFRLCLRLNEPPVPPEDLQPAGDGVQWSLSFHLVSASDPANVVDVERVWADPTGAQIDGGWRVRNVEEIVLAELGRAARICPAIESALTDEAPTEIAVSTGDAYAFLTEHMELLEESGFAVMPPDWWGTPSARLGLRLQIDAPDAAPPEAVPSGAATTGRSLLGLNTLVKYKWQVAIGEQTLTLEEFRELARQNVALVRLRGRWVEIDQAQLKEAAALFEEEAGGEISLLEAVQLAHGAAGEHTNLPVSGMDASGWVADLLNASSEHERMPNLAQPQDFIGTLRPYQTAGLSWLSFLDRFGLGACLADDMGLGKTIQLIALLLAEREQGLRPGPTLLVAPTSVISNWTREIGRFSPSLTVHVHHGPDRPVGDRFLEVIAGYDVIITTYTLVSRDAETLKRAEWHRVVLDEAQYIKNPPTKQTATIRALRTARRVALTGTPVENRLSELWSIMEFCNPGYLGPSGEFRRRFAIPIERHRDQHRAEQLRGLVRPFVLRRLKTDPNVVSDLPPCVTTKEYATLTTEQAALYERTVHGMLGQVSRAEGIQRRGLVLATLVKLKQICNHPAQLAASAAKRAKRGGAAATGADGALLSERSGKVRRLVEMLEEVLATGDKALVFTQFRQMGHMLVSMIQNELDANVMFLHGGTPPPRRQEMIDRFQDPEGGVPLFILSLKAGGIGVNLTAANHVFHFDRWWNPAVENQATDRAFRIGQTRTVHVHKFVCLGTLEERIDQMIEQKTELAQNIIGTGEDWLTGLSTGQLRELLSLRTSAMETDE